jgi:hypothetical protein
MDIDRAWKTIWVNIKISAKDSELLDQRKQAKLQRLQDPKKVNGDNQNNIRHEASRHFRNIKREYL